MAYTVISQNNTTTTLADELGNVIHVPARVTLATSTEYTITKVNNTTATLEDGNGNIVRDVPCVAVLYGGGSSDAHNKGYFATQAALEEAYPTAEPGDYAIVGATDTIWIWDEDTTAWVDTDTKGQVQSVNSKTGVVVLDANDVGAVPQYSIMPTAAVGELGKVYQYIGTTDANYTHGYFYECVSDGATPPVYSWSNVQVQASSGGAPTTATATLAVNDWSSNTQTVTVQGVTASNTVFVAPAPASNADYVAGGIVCTAQASDSLTFTCATTPSSAITVNVCIFG